MTHRMLFASSLIFSLMIAAGVDAQQPGLPHLTGSIPLPGISGRIDHMALDPDRRLLFVAALGSNAIEVVDLARRSIVYTIHGLDEPQGVCYLTAFNTLAVANGGDGTLRLFDGSSYNLFKTIPLGSDADNIRYDSIRKTIIVGAGEGLLALVNAKNNTLTGNIKLAAHPESFQCEERGVSIFVNLPDAGRIAVIDRLQRKHTAVLSLDSIKGNFPMALDEGHHRLFVGCRRPPRILVFKTDTLGQTGSVPISGDTDDLWYDDERGRVYASCGEGFIDVIAENKAGAFSRIGRIPTEPGARTSLLVPAAKALYVAVPARAGHQAAVQVYSIGK